MQAGPARPDQNQKLGIKPPVGVAVVPATHGTCPKDRVRTALGCELPSSHDLLPAGRPIGLPDRQDADGDSVPNGEDKCPAAAGPDGGCPKQTPGNPSSPGQAPGNPAPAGLFQSDATGSVLYLRQGAVDLASAGVIAVTLEREGGVAAPTTTPIIVAALSLAVIALFAVMALFSDALDFGSLFDIEPDAGNSTFLPHGWWQVVLAMPFAMWLYLGIEELPLAAEESHMPARDIPRAGMWGLGTLIISGGLVLLLNPAVVGAAGA